jgi:hypothetical protein
MDDREKAAEELGVPIDYVDRYSFPQGVCGGPFGGPGGQTINTMQVDAYTDGVKTVFFCAGRRVKCVKDWQPYIRMP